MGGWTRSSTWASVSGVRGRLTWATIAILSIAGCSQARPSGTVTGHFSLPGRPAADLLRGGLNFSTHQHGNGSGHTTRVGADGTYELTLPAGSYSVIGGLAGSPGGPSAESCDATINVVVVANATTRADYVCNPTPGITPAP